LQILLIKGHSGRPWDLKSPSFSGRVISKNWLFPQKAKS
jgi:hypothetical protein